MMVMERITSRQITVYKAANIYNIPKPKLFKYSYIKGLRGAKSNAMGRPPTLLFEQQKNIADSNKFMEKCGF
jgi:hypothetical protein